MPVIGPAKQTPPSYASGYAKSASESAHPNLWDGLVGAWMPGLGVTGETLRDVSGNDNHGTLQYDTSWKTYDSETSLYFDRVQDHVSGFDDVSLSSTEPFTIAIKVRLDSYLNAYPGLLQLKTDTSAPFFIFASQSGSYEGLNFGSADWDQLRNSPSVFVTNKTQSVAITYNGNGSGNASNYSMYLDGKQTGIIDTAGFVAYSQQNYLGALNGGASSVFNWHGSVNSFSIYKRVLSPSEIKQLYVDPLAPFRQRRYIPFGITAAPSFNNWYARPGRINRIVGSGVHV
jgi:hypothetical protein